MPTSARKKIPLRPQANILILGGTQEARELASALVAKGYDVTTSQKGATKKRLKIAGKLRIGGFSNATQSGAQGFADYITTKHFDVVVDATHPFALHISPRTHKICAQLRIPYLRLERPPWQPATGQTWTCVSNLSEALNALPHGARCFAAIGRQHIKALRARGDCFFIARTIETAPDCPPNVTQIIDRPPYGLKNELALLTRYKVTHLITKNAGGVQTGAKLIAAQKLLVNLIMINREKNQPKQDFESVSDLLESYF